MQIAVNAVIFKTDSKKKQAVNREKDEKN